jgi:hypothetical protein
MTIEEFSDKNNNTKLFISPVGHYVWQDVDFFNTDRRYDEIKMILNSQTCMKKVETQNHSFHTMCYFKYIHQYSSFVKADERANVWGV